jgi:3-hydroxyacyl-CoA dehydrogenase/enoyl-CoA hydratase/3-hydroxybutyryl-CoA epimerase
MGFPAPPLAMVDEVSLVLPQRIAAEAAKAAEAAGAGAFASPAMRVVDRMVDKFDRPGKAAGAGFYDYPSGDAKAKKTLWPGLWDHFVDPAKNPVSDEVFLDLQERFTFVMSLETITCVDEGVLRSTRDANIGSIFGIGFPPLYGGALQYVNNYQGGDGNEGGVTGFLARARELAASYGPQFEPPALLVQKAEAAERF